MAKALRDVYGEALAACARENEKIVVLDADLANCTKTNALLPELSERHFNVGIAEANMVAMGAGFAESGFIPYVNTFSTLAASMCLLTTKAMIGYSDLNVRIVGTNTGLCGGYDGATHHSYDDVNAMRAVPGLSILIPSDERMVRWAVEELSERFCGPAYMGISRNATDDIYSPEETFTIGEAKQLKDGADLTIIACGMEVGRALTAAKQLAQDGIHAAVVDMFTIKPLDRAAILRAAQNTGAIVTAEEHSIIGGLGSAVLEVLAEEQLAIPCERVGILDCYTESGSYNYLVEKFGVGVEAIVVAAKRVYEKKEGTNHA